MAVAWFTNNILFDELIKARRREVEVKVLILDDILNRNEFGLDFGELVKMGADVRFANPQKTMHNKFCIIDDDVYTGSYNWTYQANTNNENIVVNDDANIVKSFSEQFERLFSEGEIIKEPYERLKWTEVKEGDFTELRRNIFKDVIAKDDGNKELKKTKLIKLNDAYKSGDINELSSASMLLTKRDFRTITDVLTNRFDDFAYKLWEENYEGKAKNNTVGYTHLEKWFYVPYEIKVDQSHREYIEGLLKADVIKEDHLAGGLNLKIYDEGFIGAIKHFLGDKVLSWKTQQDIPDSLLKINMAQMFFYEFRTPMYNKSQPETNPNRTPRLRRGINLFGIVKDVINNKIIFYEGWDPKTRGERIMNKFFYKI